MNEQPTPPYFENPMDYMYKIANPTSIDIYPGFKEINKDIVTGNLREKEIKQFQIGSSIIGICESFDPVPITNPENNIISLNVQNERLLDDFKLLFERELMSLTNVTKSRSGFMLKRLTEHVHKVISGTQKKEVGKND